MQSPSLLHWLAGQDPVTVVPLVDPVVDALGYDPRSAYAETFWLPVLGPASLVLLRRVADCFDDRPAGFPLPLAPTAASLGLGHSGACNAPLIRTLGRVITFGMATVQGDHLAVRRRLPPLARRHITRLPGYLAERLRTDGPTRPGDDGEDTVLALPIVGQGRSGKSADGPPGSGSGPGTPPARTAATPRLSA